MLDLMLALMLVVMLVVMLVPLFLRNASSEHIASLAVPLDVAFTYELCAGETRE